MHWRAALLFAVWMAACESSAAEPVMRPIGGQGAEGGGAGGASGAASGSGGTAGSAGVGDLYRCDPPIASCGSYGMPCCDSTSTCGADGCGSGLACCVNDVCLADCVGVYSCWPACSTVPPAREIVEACIAIKDREECVSHETGGEPASCIWADQLGLRCP